MGAPFAAPTSAETYSGAAYVYSGKDGRLLFPV